MKSCILLWLLFSTFIFPQENGRWDSNSIRSTTIKLNAGQSTNLTIDLPAGTSKYFYTIKVVKKYSNENISVIADAFSSNPTTPQFAILAQSIKAGANMSDAKISYSLIAQSDNNNYTCLNNSGVVMDERVFVDYNKKECLDISGTNLKLNFFFKSENKFFELKIIFEIVSFIDYDLKRGWSLNRKNFLHENLVKYFKSEHPSENQSTIEKYVGCILMRVEEAYTYKQFELLTTYEKDEYIKKISSLCIN